MRRLGPLVIERDVNPTTGWMLGVSLLAIAAALAAAGLVFWAYGTDPVGAYAAVVRETFINVGAASEVVRRTIPLLLCGVGLTLAFRAQFWNIGAEGQLLAGAVGATAVALFAPIHGRWIIPAMFLAGFVAGALWGLMPTLLRLRLEVNEVITTLMMNYVALYVVAWLVHGPWKGATMFGFAYTDPFAEAARLPLIPGTRVHWPTLLIGLALALVLGFVLSRTRLGFEIRVLGQNLAAGLYAGINPLRTTLVVMLVSGGVAGLAGVGEVAGVHHKLLDPNQVSLGYGYAAIIVAWLARGSPLAVVLTATFLGLIFTSGDVLKVVMQMPFRVTDVFNGLMLFFLIGSERLLYYRVRVAPARAAAAAAEAHPAEPSPPSAGGEG
ncbi:MAG: ABC transporter permease [Armatimonadota bacterium]|nr:ABC transporter permease [Armatimonadota bacterium]